MKPAARIRLARARLLWCGVRASYARARIQTSTMTRTLCAHPWITSIALLWLVDALTHNLLLTLYAAPAIVGTVRKRPGLRIAILANLLLGWTGVVWIWLACWAVWPDTPSFRPVNPVRTRVHWYVSPRNGRTIRV